MSKISIIIPLHNVQDHLRECLDSVLGQTLRDIEVICIDDHSEDASPEILREFGLRDSRLRIITYAENKTASQARKDGVLAATGEYIMFLDADDSLVAEACERLYASVQRDPVDILHFGTVITTDGSLSPARVEWMREFVRPYDGLLEGASILEGGFSKERLYNFSLWDKLYSSELCKKAFSRVQDGRFPKAQDKYAYFIISYFARTYRGIPEERYYRYNFGRGVTGHNLLSFPQFERYCSMGLVADAIRGFLDEEGALESHEALYQHVRDRLLHDCVANWSKHLGADDRAPGFDLMLTYWSTAEVIAKIAELHWRDDGHVARSLSGSRSIAREPHQVRVVGTYYHRYANGGVQRVMSLLIQLWRDLGYKVVLFTDVPPSADDYDLPDGVERVVLPSYFDIDPSGYSARARALESAVDVHGIDVMVYHAWVSRILLWDLLVCRAAGVAFVAHCHSVFSQPIRSARSYFADMPFVYRLCDAVIALGEVDSAYWGIFSDNVIGVSNPLTFSLTDLQTSTLEGKNVLWLGRISDEKRPLDAVRIFAKVLAEEPDARLTMVGSADEKQSMDELNELIDDLGIRDSVVMCGFHRDVLPFYQDASVFLMTSEFEGFPTVLSESQSAGVPCVMYELPYLTLTRTGRGFVSVEMGDINAAADALTKLLGDLDYRAAMGREARANAEALSGFDHAGTWRGVFDDLAIRHTTPREDDETTRIMWETLLDHYRVGAEKRNLEVRRLKKKLAAARKAAKQGRRAEAQLQRIRSSAGYTIGRAIVFIPRRLLAWFRS